VDYGFGIYTYYSYFNNILLRIKLLDFHAVGIDFLIEKRSASKLNADIPGSDEERRHSSNKNSQKGNSESEETQR